MNNETSTTYDAMSSGKIELMDLDEAIRIAELVLAGKMIGFDEESLMATLVVAAKRLKNIERNNKIAPPPKERPRFMISLIDIEPEYVRIVDENFWDLLA